MQYFFLKKIIKDTTLQTLPFNKFWSFGFNVLSILFFIIKKKLVSGSFLTYNIYKRFLKQEKWKSLIWCWVHVFQAQHVFSPMIQGSARMITPPGHGQPSLVSSSTTQYGEQTHTMYGKNSPQHKA